MTDISVIIPVYNKQKYLANILNQLMTQSFQSFECIIIDDGSTDQSGVICDQFAKIEERIKVFHTQNRGVSNARNMGLDHAEGEYITFIDADDTVEPEYLENLYNCIRSNEADMVISGVKKVWSDSDYSIIRVPPMKGKYVIADILPDFARVQGQTGIYGTCVAKIFLKRIIGDTRFDRNLHLAEDFDFYLRIYDKVETLYLDDKAYYSYLQEAENSSVMIEDSKIDYLSQVKIQIRLRDFLVRHNEYFGENRQIVNAAISNFFYLTLYHSTEDKKVFKDNYVVLHQLYRDHHLPIAGNKGIVKLLLSMIARGNLCSAWFLMSGFVRLKETVKKGIKVWKR